MSDCTCGSRFLDAEDFRDHLPCEGPTPALTRRISELEAELAAERAHRQKLVEIFDSVAGCDDECDLQAILAWVDPDDLVKVRAMRDKLREDLAAETARAEQAERIVGLAHRFASALSNAKLSDRALEAFVPLLKALNQLSMPVTARCLDAAKTEGQ